MANAIQDVVQAILTENPHASNEDVAAAVRQMMPGAKTSAASVSSIKSRLKKEGFEVADDSETSTLIMPTLPSFDKYGEHDPNETLEDAQERIRKRYRAMGRMAERVVAGFGKGNALVPSLIISGPPGLGKSFTVTSALDVLKDEVIDEEGNPVYQIISGAISAVGLYIALWELRNGGILILDDCDDAFRDETALNILKAVLDSSPVRRVSWQKKASWLDEMGIDRSFDFRGSVIFLTNVDFEAAIASSRRDGKHFEALMDRSMYLCLTLRSRRDFMIRIRQVSEGEEGMLQTDPTLKLTAEQAAEVLDYVEAHQTRFYNLSLRLVRQIAQCYVADPEEWKDDVEATKMRTI